MAAYLEDVVVVEATATHTHTLIMLHGMSYDATMFETLPELMGAHAASIRFVFPNAPSRTIDWPLPKGPEDDVAAWYNYFSSRGGTLQHDDIDASHLAGEAARARGILDAEIAALGDPRRVALGGNSQGGTVALHAALTHPRGLELGCLLLGCTILLRETPLPAVVPAQPTPVFVFSAERDAEYLPAFQRLAFGRLARAGVELTSHVEPGLDHYTVSTAELHHTAAWLRRVWYAEDVAVTVRDKPKAPPAKFDDVMRAPLPAWWLLALQHGRRQPHLLHPEEVANMPPDWRPVFFSPRS